MSFDIETAQKTADDALCQLFQKRFRHYKGEYYYVLDVVVSEATGEILVIYESEGKGYRWCRPLESFRESIQAESGSKPRFEEVPDDLNPGIDAAERWRRAHPEEIEKHRGRHIAIHPERGIVASSQSLLDLHSRVKELGLLDEVVFDGVAW